MDNIFAGLPEELVKALKRCDLLAGDEQLEYFYKLYDPETGVFYYSISSRDSADTVSTIPLSIKASRNTVRNSS